LYINKNTYPEEKSIFRTNKELEDRAIELISFCQNDETVPEKQNNDLRTLLSQGKFTINIKIFSIKKSLKN
jgi:hypothetical protein